MNDPKPVRYAVACCWNKSFSSAVPWVPLGQLDLADLERRLADALPISTFALYPGCRSLFLQWHALWMVLELTNGSEDPATGDVNFESASLLRRGGPSDVCEWLLAQGLPTPSDDTEVAKGVNTQHLKAEHGLVVGARFGVAEVGFMGTATAFMGEAIAGDRGIAIVGASGTARAGAGGAAISNGWSNAQAAERGVAVTLDEFCSAVAGASGVAVASFGGTATAGPMGIAIADRGTVLGGAGALLVIRTPETIVVGRVGENGIEANTPYHARGNKLVEGAWDMEQR